MTEEQYKELKAAKATDWSEIAKALAPALTAGLASQGIQIQVVISAESVKELAGVIKAGIAR